MAAFSNLPLSSIKHDLLREGCECSHRGLTSSAKWLLEMAASLPGDVTSEIENVNYRTAEFSSEYDKYMLAKAYFDSKEFKRAAFHGTSLKSHRGKFLKHYATYKSTQQEQLYEKVPIIGRHTKSVNKHLLDLKDELNRTKKELDAFGLWLHGIVLKRLDLHEEAIEVFQDALEMEPLLWAAWDELSLLCKDRDMLRALRLPDHWMSEFFEAQAFLDVHLNEEALMRYTSLSQAGFRKSIYIQSQIALAHYNLKDFENAVVAFQNIQKEDPCRLENLDAFSNVLYIQNDRPSLSLLAHHVAGVDKYRPESCCVIGNYYSLSGEHEKALLYFRQALRLNDQYVAVWTLLGHEYVELKNISAAIEAYRKATEVNSRDYRAWYGLGQTYELLKMPFYSLFYYKEAHNLRPNDFRMLVALGDTYQCLEMPTEAKLCFWRAVRLGDSEGQATIKLAKVLEQSDEDEAAMLYENYVDQLQLDEQCVHAEDAVRALSFLTRYHLKKNDIAKSKAFSRKAATLLGGKKEAENLMEEITRQMSSKS